jgi:dTDP-4-amino-4,6-dideoxygalactose transaminase
MNIPLIKPYITDEIKRKVCEVLDSGYLTEGLVTRDLEQSVASYIGCKYALAVTSCTTGLEMALRALKIGPGDEVVVPDYTYPATASVVNIVGAKVVIVDVDPATMLIDLDALERSINLKTRAIIPVSLFGNPLNYNRLNKIKKEHGLKIIEDAACSIGAEYENIKIGKWADISVFSFHPRKFITTGEGGIVTTDNAEWAEWMESYKHFGIGVSESRSMTSFDRIGTNYKLSNIQAAVGLVQMQHIDELLGRRRELAENYRKLLQDCPKAIIPETTDQGVHSYQSFCVHTDKRDGIMSFMREQGIEVQIGTYSLHMHKAFIDNPDCRIVGKMNGSQFAFDNCLTLPLYHDLLKTEQQYIVEQLNRALK